MDACTVTALDVITAFGVPNPNYSSQSRRFFQVWLLFELPRRADHSAYIGLAKFYFEPTLSAVDASNLRDLLKDCQRPFYGLPGRRVSKAVDMADALKAAIESGKPSLLEVEVEPTDSGFFDK